MLGCGWFVVSAKSLKANIVSFVRLKKLKYCDDQIFMVYGKRCAYIHDFKLVFYFLPFRQMKNYLDSYRVRANSLNRNNYKLISALK